MLYLCTLAIVFGVQSELQLAVIAQKRKWDGRLEIIHHVNDVRQ